MTVHRIVLNVDNEKTSYLRPPGRTKPRGRKGVGAILGSSDSSRHLPHRPFLHPELQPRPAIQ